MSDPVPAYLDPAITPPVDQEQHLKQTDVATAILRAQLAALIFARSATPQDRADDILRETGYFRLRYEELVRFEELPVVAPTRVE